MFKLIRRSISLFVLIISLISWIVLGSLLIAGLITWYKFQDKDNVHTWGISWSTKQAQLHDLHPVDDLDKLLSDIPFKRLQLFSYWDLIEVKDNEYNFDTLDQQFMIAKNRNLKISLQLGLHQSHLDNCHKPAWTNNMNKEQLLEELQNYLEIIIARFDDNLSLIEYQLEPEIENVKSENCQYLLSKEELSMLYQHINSLTDKDISVSYGLSAVSFTELDLAPNGIGLSHDPFKPKKETNFFSRRLPAKFYTFQASNLKIRNSQANIFIRKFNLQPNTPINQKKYIIQIEQALEYAQATDIKTIDLYGLEWLASQSEPDLLSQVKKIVSMDF